MQSEMKAVVYHANAHFAWGGDVGDLYERLFKKFVEHCHGYGIDVIHLTLEGHPGWGDENRYYANLDPKNVMLNREECFTQFIGGASWGVYWFAEPDYRITKMWPPLRDDCHAALLYRKGDDVPNCPAWRLATPRAYPLFKKWRDVYRTLEPYQGVGFDWHGDSWAFTKVWKEMGRPKAGDVVEYEGVSIEFRDYADYIKPLFTYGRNYFGNAKGKLLEHN